MAYVYVLFYFCIDIPIFRQFFLRTVKFCDRGATLDFFSSMYRAQLGECIKTIVHADYPEEWPSLLPWVKHNLQDQQVYAALYILRILSRKYEYVRIE